MDAIDNVTCIPLWDCLLVPLHGDVPDAHADALVTEVLERVQRDACTGVLVDLSGVWTLDSHLGISRTRTRREAQAELLISTLVHDDPAQERRP